MICAHMTGISFNRFQLGRQKEIFFFSILQKPINKKKIFNKWTVATEMTDRSVLSDELANFCSKYPIYNVKRMDDSLTATRIQTAGEKHFMTLQILQLLKKS